MGVLNYESLPAYRAAQRLEARNREREFTGALHDVCGIRIRAMSLRDNLALDEIQSPFLSSRIPTRAELCFFLWLLSPAFEKWNEEIGWRKQWIFGCRWKWFSVEFWQSLFHGRRCRKLLKLDDGEKITEKSPRVIATKACFDYIDRMFRDCPIPNNAGNHESYFSYLADWCDKIRTEYKCSEHEVLTMPLPKLWQYIRAITRRHDPSSSWPSPECQKIKKAVRQALKDGQFTIDDFIAGRPRWTGERWAADDSSKN